MFGRRKNDVYHDLFMRHPQPMWVFEIATRRFLEVNDAACTNYGYTRPQMLRMTLDDIRPPEDREAVIAAVRENAHKPFNMHLWRHRRADGSVFYVDVMSSAFLFEKRPARIVLAVDATPRVAVSRALSESRAALSEAQELAHLGSFESDLVSGETRWSAELFRMYGVDPARERPQPLSEFDHPEDRAGVVEALERARQSGTEFTSEHRIVTRDGRERHVFERGRFFYENGTPSRMVGAVLDITDRKIAEQRLRRLAELDALTGLPNRTLLRANLAQAVERARAAGGEVGVLFVDLDRFKGVNDTIAHAAGDEVLREIAERIASLIGENGVVGRPGGDEFVVILPRLESETAGIATAYELLAAVAGELEVQGSTLVITASAGLAIFPRDGDTPDELLRSADGAMYAAKARGGNTVELYRPALHVEAVAELELERALRGAIEREIITVAYQPIVDAQSGRVVALEALARWNDNGRTIVPNDFIPLAEASGLIVRLGSYVLNMACREIRRLHDLGFNDLAMCVNISARQFREFDFAGRIYSAIVAADIPPESLHLEITESAYLSAESGLRNIEALRELGVRLSIDDFGTGYSSLGYLKRLPVSAVKIDRSFVADILNDPADQAIVRAIIAVAQNLNLLTIAEGVETAAHVEFLRAMGCSQLQGFFFARALPPSAIEAYLRKLPSLR
jgi:diguanylate cyclase (GGDEF)-like protein/PAS domain S-box-containing protein